MDLMEVNEVTNAVNQLLHLSPDIAKEVVFETIPPAPIEFGEELSEPNVISKSSVACPYCEKKYKNMCNVRRHMINVHKMNSNDLNNHKVDIKCGFDKNCTASFSRIAYYQKHLSDEHDVEIEKVVMSFTSLEEFLEWKAAEEKESHLRFNRFAYRERSEKIKKRTYICCFSGKYFPKGRKTKETMKLGTYCPAKMDVVYNHKKVILTYFKTHIGHGVLQENWATSEQQRMKNAAWRKKRRYEDLKAIIKAKLQHFIEDLNLDKYSLEFLKSLTKTLDSVFDPESQVKTKEAEKRCDSHEHKTVAVGSVSSTTESLDISSNITSGDLSNNALVEHGYVSTSSVSTSTTQKISTTQGSTSNPVIVSINSPNRNSPNVTNNNGSKTFKVLLLHTPNNIEPDKPIKSIIIADKSLSECTNAPVVVLGKDSTKVLQPVNAQTQPNVVVLGKDSAKVLPPMKTQAQPPAVVLSKGKDSGKVLQSMKAQTQPPVLGKGKGYAKVLQPVKAQSVTVNNVHNPPTHSVINLSDSLNIHKSSSTNNARLMSMLKRNDYVRKKLNVGKGLKILNRLSSVKLDCSTNVSSGNLRALIPAKKQLILLTGNKLQSLCKVRKTY